MNLDFLVNTYAHKTFNEIGSSPPSGKKINKNPTQKTQFTAILKDSQMSPTPPPATPHYKCNLETKEAPKT